MQNIDLIIDSRYLFFQQTYIQFFYTFLITIFAYFFVILITNKLQLSLIRSTLIFLWHYIFIIFYYIFTKYYIADTLQYYTLGRGDNAAFNFGSATIVYTIRQLHYLADFSYFNYFVIFGSFGTFGLIIFDSLFNFTTYSNKIKKIIAKFIIFLPGLNFWSASIGKDSIALFSLSLIALSINKFEKKFIIFMIGILILFYIRPYMGAIVGISFFISIIFLDKININIRIFIIILFGGILYYLIIPAVAYTTQVININDLYSFNFINLYNDIIDYIKFKQSSEILFYEEELIYSNFLFKILSYLFNPIFNSTKSFFIVYTSIENLIILISISYLLLFLLSGKKIMFSDYFIIIFIVLSLLLLSQVTNNIGIANRQKWMVIPFIYYFLFSFGNIKK